MNEKRVHIKHSCFYGERKGRIDSSFHSGGGVIFMAFIQLQRVALGHGSDFLSKSPFKFTH